MPDKYKAIWTTTPATIGPLTVQPNDTGILIEHKDHLVFYPDDQKYGLYCETHHIALIKQG